MQFKLLTVEGMKPNDDGSGGDINVLPEECVANVFSLTGPRDACRLSVVSSTFKSASESDAVWEQFLPNDYQAIISSSNSSVLSASSSKKHLYLYLCDHPILVDNGKKSFALDKLSGKICYMLSARDLVIAWGDSPRYWRWTSELKSRFEEVAELVSVCWLEIKGRLNARMLSPETLYAAYLVYNKTAGVYGFEDQPIQVTVEHAGTQVCTREVSLDSGRERSQQNQIVTRRIGLFNHSRAVAWRSPVQSEKKNDVKYPPRRKDGWLEIELGEFYNKQGGDEEIEIKITENRGNWKGGIVVQGIDIRPKQEKYPKKT